MNQLLMQPLILKNNEQQIGLPKRMIRQRPFHGYTINQNNKTNQ
jgi:hypothetical protein